MLSSSPVDNYLMLQLACNIQRMLNLEYAPLTQTAHQPFVASGWHNMGVLLAAGVQFGLQHAVGILQMKFKER